MNQYRVRRIAIAGLIAFGWVAPIANSQTIAAGTMDAQRAMRDAVLGRVVAVRLDNVSLDSAIDAVTASAGVHAAYNATAVRSLHHRVTLHAERLTLGTALDAVLDGTGLHARPIAEDMINIEVGMSDGTSAGVVTGTITDATTRRPLRGVTISIDDAKHGVATSETGTFRIPVSAGRHRVSARLIGYVRTTITIDATEGETTTANMTLSQSTSTLEQVVVTGTVIPTELKAVPNAITVITAKEIEQRGITKIDQLFRGEVPGIFAQNLGSAALLGEVTMFSRGATNFGGPGADATNPIKTYVDGVELADPKYLSQIDPKSIERIEILTGPQASTIYGSNAINGVMQVFTKRGTSNTPQLTLNLLSGFVQNNFSNALTPQHDYGARVDGQEGHLSYAMAGAWDYTGAWTPAAQLSHLGASGGFRLDVPTHLGRLSTDISLRQRLTQNRKRGDVGEPLTALEESGWWSIFYNLSPGITAKRAQSVNNQTLGLTLSYAPSSWWSHEIVLGSDVSDTESRQTAARNFVAGDTMLSMSQDHVRRRSMRYTTTARFEITSLAQLTMAAGVDGWQELTSSASGEGLSLTGSFTNSAEIDRRPAHNTGIFQQIQLGVKDQLFFTFGLREEWNPNYGADAEPNLAPRYGVVYTRELGAVTAKLRGAYGRSTRPPLPWQKVSQSLVEYWGSSWSYVMPLLLPYYDPNFKAELGNRELGPEHQQGGEGGLELFLGSRASLIMTRYNQTVDGLIAEVAADSVHSLIPCNAYSPPCLSNSLDAAGYAYYRQLQYVNLGSIRNEGWELQGTINTGPLMTHGTYSWTKSRMIGITKKYVPQFPASSYPQYQPGATFQYLPEHTWALGTTYTHGSFSAGLDVTHTGPVAIQTNDFFLLNLQPNIRLMQNQLNVSNIGSYANFNPPYVLAELHVWQRITSRFDASLQIQNLGNKYVNDWYAAYASIGRQVKFGGRMKL